MKIEKTECSYQVTQCDLKFGEQITLDDELLMPVSVLDKIRTEIEGKIIKRPRMDFRYSERERNETLLDVLDIIDKHLSELRGDTDVKICK